MKMPHAIRTLVLGISFAAMTGYAQMASLPPAQFDVVTLPGTGDSQDVLRDLARGYTAQYPDRQVVVPDSIGSDGGVRVVGTGEAPIGRVARRPNSEEIAQYGEFMYVEFARVPVAFVVSPNAGVHNLGEQQICDIFSGRITNWQDAGGNDLPIDVQSRPLGSNLLTIRKNMACFAELEFTPKAHFNLHNADLVAAMQTFAGAIGFMPLSEAELHGYHTVTLDGVAPSEPQYKLGIGLGFVYKKPLSASIQAFLDYLKTAPAQEVMRKTGHVPVEGLGTKQALANQTR
jgi:phosphate transport system substrate-binding protein